MNCLTLHSHCRCILCHSLQGQGCSAPSRPHIPPPLSSFPRPPSHISHSPCTAVQREFWNGNNRRDSFIPLFACVLPLWEHFVPNEAAQFSLRKSDYPGCAVLLCFVVCLTLLASFFLPSHLSLNVYCTVCCISHGQGD